MDGFGDRKSHRGKNAKQQKYIDEDEDEDDDNGGGGRFVITTKKYVG